MNPLTNMKNVKKLSEQELATNSKSSWHDQYKDSAWIFVGGLPYDLTEGDIICIFSQYGEIVNINLIRNKDSGKSKGFCFICYEDQQSTVLAVDNFNGIKVLGRILRVDHVSEYKVPKEGKKTDEDTKRLYREGCAPQLTQPVSKTEIVPIKIEPNDIRETLADQISGEIKLPQRLPIYPIKQEKNDSDEDVIQEKKKRSKKYKKEKKKAKKKRTSSSSKESDSELEKDVKKSAKKHKSHDSSDTDLNQKKHRAEKKYEGAADEVSSKKSSSNLYAEEKRKYNSYEKNDEKFRKTQDAYGKSFSQYKNRN